MSNSKDFKADSYQVGDLQRALRSSIDGDLVFTDEFFPAGVRLRDFASSQIIYAVNEATSASLQVQITANKDDISLLDGRVTINEIDIEALKTSTQAISSFSNVFLGLVDTPNSYTDANSYILTVSGDSIVFTDPNFILSGVQSQVIDISGDLSSLQLQVNNIVQETTAITGDSTLTIGQTGVNFSLSVADYISATEVYSISGDLQSKINDIDLTPFALSSNLLALSGEVQDLDDKLDNYATNAYVLAVSGDLLNQINSITQGSISISGDNTLVIGQTGVNFSLSVADYISATEVYAISGNLQSKINDIDLTPFALTSNVLALSGEVQNLDSKFANYAAISYVNDISSNLQGQITSNDNDISDLQSQVISISSNFDNYATNVYVLAISGDLQSQINNIVQETTTITGDSTLTIGQTGVNFSLSVNDYISATEVYAISGDLQYKITSNDNDISDLQSQVISISSNFDNYATNVYVLAISGDLQSQINNIVQETTTITGDSTLTIGQTGVNFSLSVNDYISATEVYAISGDLQYKITSNDNDISDLQSQVISISSNFDNYATNVYVLAISGDLQSQINNIVQETTTITGDSTLTIGQTGVNFSLSVADYISATEVYAISGELRSNISSLAKKGVISLNTIDNIYTVNNTNIEATSYPICTLIAPSQDSNIYPFYVFDIATGSFKVELSDTPAISGYKLSWLVI